MNCEPLQDTSAGRLCRAREFGLKGMPVTEANTAVDPTADMWIDAADIKDIDAQEEAMAEQHLFPANPASTAENVGCAAWQRFADDGETVLCSPTVVAIIDDLPACGWCTEAYMRGAA